MSENSKLIQQCNDSGQKTMKNYGTILYSFSHTTINKKQCFLVCGVSTIVVMIFFAVILFFGLASIVDEKYRKNIEKTKKAFENDIRFPIGMNYTQYIDSIKNIVPYDSQRWTDGIVYYTIDSAFNSDNLKLIIDSLSEMSEQIGYRTDGQKCIRFQERTVEQDYLNIIQENGCWSYIGRSFGAQELSIGDGCYWKGIIKHEVMHALGFWHEHSRPDRDQYVTVRYENIAPPDAYNFERLLFTRVMTRFDLDSIMIYDNYAYTINGEPTITANNGQQLLHAYLKPTLTELNRQAIRLLYKCSEIETTTTSVSMETSTSGTTDTTITTSISSITTSVSSSTGISEFVCENEGYFANPLDCSQFYRCVQTGQGFTRYEFVCSAGTVWSNLLNACVFGTNDNCPQ